MINSTAFDYVNVLTKAADASYQREAILANNMLRVSLSFAKRCIRIMQSTAKI